MGGGKGSDAEGSAAEIDVPFEQRSYIRQRIDLRRNRGSVCGTHFAAAGCLPIRWRACFHGRGPRGACGWIRRRNHDREAFANTERFPMAHEIFTSFEDAFEKLRPNASSYLVIVTRGHKEDMRVLGWAVRTQARYVGMIGSRRKVFSVYKALEKEGYRMEEFERVFAPMGLEIGALSPEEIAISIVAELVAVRRNSETAWHKKVKLESAVER